MVICLCKGVNEKQLVETVNSTNGCCSMKHIRCTLGVGQKCGKCLKAAKELLERPNTASRTN